MISRLLVKRLVLSTLVTVASCNYIAPGVRAFPKIDSANLQLLRLREQDIREGALRPSSRTPLLIRNATQ